MTPALYRHHDGGLYTLLFVATESTNSRAGTPVAVYVSLTTGQVKVRELVEFEEIVEWPAGVRRPRFVLTEEP